MTAAQSVLAALLARERGAGGQHIRLSMIDTALAFLWPDGMMQHTLLDTDGRSRPARTWPTATWCGPRSTRTWR